MAKPTLSVVMPNYNHLKYLPKALDALAARERPPDELIVIDDGSSDNSWEIVQAFASKYSFIRAYKNDRNMGVEYTVSRGVELASGDYLCGVRQMTLSCPASSRSAWPCSSNIRKRDCAARLAIGGNCIPG